MRIIDPLYGAQRGNRGNRTRGNPSHKQEGGGIGGAPHPKKRLFNKQERGDLVFNDDIHQDMKVPAPYTYDKVFHPDFWRKIPACNHPDGTEKCNNYHHRGRCHSKCNRSASHSKKLTEDEISCGKQYVEKVVTLYKKAQNDNKDKEDGSTNEEQKDTNGVGKKK